MKYLNASHLVLARTFGSPKNIKRIATIVKTTIKELDYDFDTEASQVDKLIEIISIVRGEKTNNNVSLKTPVTNITISIDKELNEALEKAIKDFKATLTIENLTINTTDKNYKIDNIELSKDSE